MGLPTTNEHSETGSIRTHFRNVESFEELIATPFEHGLNAVCWRRELHGDFDEIVRTIGPIPEITTIEESDLLSLTLSPRGREARDILIQDQRLLRDAGLLPSLDCIPAYPKDAEDKIVPTDVYDFHADSANVKADTFLCSYNVAASEGIPFEHAIRYIDIPSIKAELLHQFGAEEGDAFKRYVKERYFDLHYTCDPLISPYTFGIGNLWKIATQCPGSLVPPCIHRAPTTQPGQLPRLLLIS